jgi:class 3 adenylate cyclase
MKTSKEILDEVRNVLATNWISRDGRKVPEAEDVKLGNDAVKIEGSVLYADLKDSTGLVDGFKDWFAAECYKSYLLSACHAIRNHAGVITSFDGDRVMGVYFGDYKNTSAAKSALNIRFLVAEINKLVKAKYPTTAYVMQASIGIDTSPLFVAKTGIRANNDLVWIGRAANYAAKLATLGPYIHVTEGVYSKLHAEAKLGGTPQKNMWEKVMWEQRGVPIYRTGWQWNF